MKCRMIYLQQLNDGLIEVRILLVSHGKVGQPLCEKGIFAEDSIPCPRNGFWDAIKYVADCHIFVECYRCCGNTVRLCAMNELFTKSFMVLF